MRSMILICVSMFVLFAGISYCGLWYFKARALKSNMEEGFKRVNAKHTYFTYDTIETSGFPLDVKVSVVNPHFNGRFDEFLKDTFAIKQPLPAWEDDSKLNGTISWGLNLFANHYYFNVTGTWQATSTIAGKRYVYKTTMPADTRCDLQLANTAGIFDTLWDIRALAQYNGAQLAHNFRTFDCSAAGYNLVDDANESLMSGGDARFFINSDTVAGYDSHRNIRLYVKTSDSEITPAGDELINAYLTALFPSVTLPTPYSTYGKSNAEINLSYKGPIEQLHVMGSTPVELHLSSFNLSNAAYQSQGNLHFTNNGDEKKRRMRLNFAFHSNYGEAYDQMLHQMVRGFVLQLYSPFAPQPANIQPLIRKYSANDLYNIVAPSIPNMHSMGKLTQSLDFSYDGNPAMTEGDISFTNLNFSSDAYGITGRGSVKVTTNHPMPAANILLSCANCNRLVDDATDYTLRLERTMNTLSGEQTHVNLFSTPQADGIKAFLNGLAYANKSNANASDAMAKGTYEYEILSNGAGNLTINDKRLDEILVLYSQTIAPALQNGQPPVIGQ